MLRQGVEPANVSLAHSSIAFGGYFGGLLLIAAMTRRRRVVHPTLGDVWIISPEDLVIAKLEWSEGTSEMHLRDVRSIIRLVDDLDWAYLERHASTLGIGDRLESVRGG